uniref:Uncharacterized protein n=1 Tax=viral metagenome TaxID=1070528 RepID=A0A6C0HHN5_9ZZZZ
MKVVNCIGIAHLIGVIIENLYGFIFPHNILFDKLYAISFISIPFSWILFNDECIISYIVKRCNNPKYVLGTTPQIASDIPVIFTNPIVSYRMFHVNTLLRITSICIVNGRTCHIPCGIFGPSILLYLAYVNDIEHEWNYRKICYPRFHVIAAVYFTWFLYSL